MNTTNLQEKFARIGARLKVAEQPSRRFRVGTGAVSLDVQNDRDGEFFEVAGGPSVDADVSVLDVQARDRHLLLLVRERGEKHKYLCGHDERHWFVAAIPESAPVGTVRQAKESLKPVEVRAAQASVGLRSRARERRKNSAYVRQGEWFFLPAPRLVVDDALVLRNEPLIRSNGGKPHWTEFCFRTGGELVYVCPKYPKGVTEARYHAILESNARAHNWPWRSMRRNPGVYVRGRVRHADHRPIVLHGWHRVLMNRENESRALRNVAFLD